MADMLKVVMNKIDDKTPVATAVIVVRDNNTLLLTRTRSKVELQGSMKVVFLEGIAGFYSADRIYDATEIGKGLGVVHG